jgi:hypothetical protein
MSLHLLILTGMFVAKYDEINYENIPKPEFLIFVLFYKQITILILVLYSIFKTSYISRVGRGLNIVYLVYSLVLFITISIKAGSRTDILALLLGIALFECYPLSNFLKNKRKILLLSLFILIVGYTLIFIENTRSKEDKSDLVLTQKILLKDYYAPSHILYAAIHLKYIEPLKVVFSNTANALVKLNYPYLQTEIGNIISPDSSSRSTGYAFYIFTEGFIALGWLGFLYNGVVVCSGIYLWRWLSSSQNIQYNLFILAVSATQMANIARSQSMYFVKDIYLIFFPAMFLYYLGTGLRPVFCFKVNKRISS